MKAPDQVEGRHLPGTDITKLRQVLATSSREADDRRCDLTLLGSSQIVSGHNPAPTGRENWVKTRHNGRSELRQVLTRERRRRTRGVT